jgi:hypothetical protein
MMQENSRHIVKLEAIRFIDGEMSSAEMTRVELHMQKCADCREMMSEINNSVSQLKSILSTAEQVHGQEQARESLKVRLGDAQQNRSAYISILPGWLTDRRHVRQLAAAGIVVVLALIGIGKRSASGGFSPHSDVAMLPNKGLTPGAVRQVALQDLCALQQDEDLDPGVASATQKKVFYEYGVSVERQGKDFQVDYLINPQLGGTDDIHNLWPQPYHSSEWNASAKDALERHLHRMVCDGKVDLAEAQRDISTNWIAAYQKYFHTTKPV